MKDITKMPIIGTLTTKELEYTVTSYLKDDNNISKHTLPKETYSIVEIQEYNGHTYYITNQWYKEYKGQPQIIVDELVEEYTPIKDSDRYMEEGGYLHGSPNDFCDTGFKLGAGKGQGENLWGRGHYFTNDKDLATYYAKFIKSSEVTDMLEQKVADKLGFEKYSDIPYEYEKKGIRTKYGQHLKFDLFNQYLKQYVDKHKNNGIVYEVTLFPGKDKKDYKIIDFSGENYRDDEVKKRDKKDLKNLIDTLSKNKKTYAKAVKLFFDKKGWEFDLQKYNERFADTLKTMSDYYNNFDSYSASTPLLYSLGYDIKRLFEPRYFDYAKDYKIIYDKIKSSTDEQQSDLRNEEAYYKGVLFTEFIKDAGYDAIKYFFSPSIIPFKDEDEHGASAIVVFDDENVEIDNCKVAEDGMMMANRITCHNCSWSWELKDAGDDTYICHKCNTDNSMYYKNGGVLTYRQKYNKKYGYNQNESHDLNEIAKDTGISKKGLQQIYNKGIGAYKTNPQSVRPNVKSKEQWAMGRVYSAVMGGKAARIDANELKMKDGGEVLLAPNGKPSNLTPEQYRLVRTAAFKKWFGDWENSPETASKVIDKNGEPLVVYHFTDAEFTIFEINSSSKGFFFTENPKDDEFSTEGMIELLEKKKYPKWLKEYIEVTGLSKEEVKQKLFKDSRYKKGKAFFLNIRKMYDSAEIGKIPAQQWSIPMFENEHIKMGKIFGYNGVEFIRKTDNKRIIVAFEPEQIKLADGTNTTFDSNNPDIRYAGGGEIQERKETYKKWRSLVNMSKTELERFYNSQEGKDAGLSSSEASSQGISSGRESARWIMRMKDTPVSEWTPSMWRWAKKQISFISRMSGNKGPLYDEKGRKTRKHTSLLIWGHNPKKYELGGLFHGSPNDFCDTGFDTKKVGSSFKRGAMGWGIYFSNKEDVAKRYSVVPGEQQSISYEKAKELVRNGQKVVGTKISENNGHTELMMRMAKREEDITDDFKWHKEVDSPYMYRVSLHKGKTPDQYDYAEFILTETQILKLKKQAIKENIVLPDLKYYGKADNLSTAYNFLSEKLGGDKEASLFFLRAGIDGIKYPCYFTDSISVKHRETCYNYVVFDSSNVSIEECDIVEKIELLNHSVINNFQSGSSLDFYQDLIFVIGDDAKDVVVLYKDFTEAKRVNMFQSETARIPKDIKYDLETSTIVDIDGVKNLLILGSGAKQEFRSVGYLIPLNTKYIVPEPFRYNTFVSRLKKEDGIKEINIEGCASLPNKFLLANRGNKTNPDNLLIVTENNFWENQENATISVCRMLLPDKDAAVSELNYDERTDTLFFTASIEHTTNAIDDGKIGDSFIGYVKNISDKLNQNTIQIDYFHNLSEVSPNFAGHKIEGMCIENKSGNSYIINLVSDNDNEESTIFKIKLITEL